MGHLSGDIGVGERAEPEDSTSGLNRFDDFGGIIAGQNKPARLGVLFHDSAKGALGIVG